MTVINTNTASISAQYNLGKLQKSMDEALQALSSGKRITSAADDAAGLSIVTRMESQVRGLNQALRNAADGNSLAQTAEGAMEEVTNMLQRMRELALQSANGTTTSDDRNYLNKEYANLINEIERIAASTQWNGRNILDGAANGTGDTTVAFQVGANGGQTISVNFGNISQDSGSGTTVFETFEQSGTLAAGAFISAGTTASAITTAASAIDKIDSAITEVNSQRATYGAAINQLTYAVDNLSSVKVNAEASRSRILDTDYALETSELARTQIIQQAGTAMLAQANQLPQTVLSLLQ